MTPLRERALAAYASEQDVLQNAYDRETDSLIRTFRQDMAIMCSQVLDMPVSIESVIVEPINNGAQFRATVTIDGLTFALTRSRAYAMRPDDRAYPMFYVLLVCNGCAAEYAPPVRSLAGLGEALSDGYCGHCRHTIGGQS